MVNLIIIRTILIVSYIFRIILIITRDFVIINLIYKKENNIILDLIILLSNWKRIISIYIYTYFL